VRERDDGRVLRHTGERAVDVGRGPRRSSAAARGITGAHEHDGVAPSSNDVRLVHEHRAELRSA
jgi:hypothetical protein